jgi:hypothetical protein
MARAVPAPGGGESAIGVVQAASTRPGPCCRERLLPSPRTGCRCTQRSVTDTRRFMEGGTPVVVARSSTWMGAGRLHRRQRALLPQLQRYHFDKLLHGSEVAAVTRVERQVGGASGCRDEKIHRSRASGLAS